MGSLARVSRASARKKAARKIRATRYREIYSVESISGRMRVTANVEEHQQETNDVGVEVRQPATSSLRWKNGPSGITASVARWRIETRLSLESQLYCCA